MSTTDISSAFTGQRISFGSKLKTRGLLGSISSAAAHPPSLCTNFLLLLVQQSRQQLSSLPPATKQHLNCHTFSVKGSSSSCLSSLHLARTSAQNQASWSLLSKLTKTAGTKVEELDTACGSASKVLRWVQTPRTQGRCHKTSADAHLTFGLACHLEGHCLVPTLSSTEAFWSEEP